jgi:hypothetical protein
MKNNRINWLASFLYSPKVGNKVSKNGRRTEMKQWISFWKNPRRIDKTRRIPLKSVE